LLGFVQGLTEFLPVSSSGHLTILPALVGLPTPPLMFDIAVHAATLVAVVVYFRADLLALMAGLAGKGEEPGPKRRLAGLLVLATAPAVVAALLWEEPLKALFSEPRLASAALVVCGLWLLAASFLKEGELEAERLPWHKALIVGIAQAVALVPGISRSGATIATGLLLGLKRHEALRLSFLMMVIAVAGATAKGLIELVQEGAGGLAAGPVLAGIITAAVSGYFAIALVMRFVEKGKLGVFAIYCLAAGLVFSLILS
jgi:undecaprenyl-diphosphatase